MKILSITTLAIICASLSLFLSLRSAAQLSDPIELSIAYGGIVKTGVPKLQLTFRNLGDEEINLYLGATGGKGPRPCNLGGREITCTFNFSLSVTDVSGTTRIFKFRGMDFVGGRLDPYIVRLQANSTNTIDLGIDQFWSPDTGDYKTLRLDAGKYYIALQFEGREPGIINSDQPYIKQMNFWKGKLTSNILAIEIASMEAARPTLAASWP